MKYIIITPANNEEDNIRYLIDSILNQTQKPAHWIIVDDGSQDDTFKIAKNICADFDWISVIQNNTNQSRASGGKVIKAFKYGLEYVSEEYDFLVKLDADVILPDNYFESIIKEFKENSSLGICGGIIKHKQNGKEVFEKTNKYHVRGALKSIRKSCYRDIGGFKEVLGWDGLDEMKAMQLGWQTYSIPLPVFHRRPTRSYYNPLKLQYKLGYSAHLRRNSFLLVILRTIKNILIKPYIISGFSYFTGYFVAVLKNEPSVIDKELARYINTFHWKRIIKKTN